MALKSVRHGADISGPLMAVWDGRCGARYAAGAVVMYWLLLSFPATLVIASVATAVVTALLYLKTLLRRSESVARLTCRESVLSRYVWLHCHAFRRPLSLPPGLAGPHTQSLLALWAGQPEVQFDRQYLQLSDGGLVALDWEVGGAHLPRSQPLLLVLPDLPTTALHLAALCREAFTFGLRAVVVNRRGQGGSPLTTPLLPGYGHSGDLREVVRYLREQQAGVALSAVGVGTGGDLLLSYLGQFGSSAHLKSAVCISPSYSGEGTLHGLRFPYSCLYLSHLKHAVLAHSRLFGRTAQLARGAWSVKELDRRLHCRDGAEEKTSGEGVEGGEAEGRGKSARHQPEHGTLDDFWAENEPLREADEIGVPALCVSSLDDPVSPARHIQHDLFRALPNLFLLTLPRGGHAGFRASPRGISWAESAAIDFVLAMMTFNPDLHASDPADPASCGDVEGSRQAEDGLHLPPLVTGDYDDDDVDVDDDDGNFFPDDLRQGTGEMEAVTSRSERHAARDGCPNGYCVTSSGPLEMQTLSVPGADADRQARSPTETHG